MKLSQPLASASQHRSLPTTVRHRRHRRVDDGVLAQLAGVDRRDEAAAPCRQAQAPDDDYAMRWAIAWYRNTQSRSTRKGSHVAAYSNT